MDKFDRDFNRVATLAWIGALISTVLGLALTGVVIWAVIRLVQHFAG